MRKKWGTLAIVLSVVFVTALSGCGSSASQSKDDATKADSGDGTIKLGIITSLTGSGAEFGKDHERGYNLALDEINQAGGVLGKKIELKILDDKSSPEEAAKDVDQLVTQDKVQLLLGAYSSGSTLAVVKKATEYKTPLIVPTAVAANITETGSKYVFRICATSDSYATAVVNFLKDRPDAKTMAIIYEDGNFGTSSAESMKLALKDSGIKLIDEESYSVKNVDYKPMLQRVKAKNPDILYFASYSLDATALMKQAHEIDLNANYFTAAGTGFSVATFTKDTGMEAEYTLAAGQWDPSATWNGSKEFDEKIFKLYNEHPSYHYMEAYAALYVAKAALEQAGEYNKDKIRDSLSKLQMDTAFGPIKFDEKGQNNHPVIITQVQNGKFETVYPKEAASAEAKLPTPPWEKR
ncbi:MAG TPA: ABC transporter substrate-binding protein [Bacilli bacterium]